MVMGEMSGGDGEGTVDGDGDREEWVVMER